MNDTSQDGSKPRYRWPWFVLAAVVLGIVLAILWMSVAVRRTREQRDPNPFPPATAPTAPSPNGPVHP